MVLREPGWTLLLASVCIGGATGCLGTWRPSLEEVEHESPDQPLTLASCLRADRLGRWVYERRQLPIQEEQEAILYTRRGLAGRFIEGVLEQHKFLPIERYLQPTEKATTRPADLPGPAPPLKTPKLIFFRLQEALRLIPAGLRVGDSVTSKTVITNYDYMGRPFAEGALTRVVGIEGLENVECPGGVLEECIRVRVDITIRYPLTPVVYWTSYHWFAPRWGEVRRIRRVSGWFLIFWFGSAYEDKLVSHEPSTATTRSPPLPPAPWRSGAVLFERAVPHPQISGMLVDFAPPSPPE